MKERIILKKLNESWVSIKTDAHVHYEIEDHFKYLEPSRFFMPSFKNKMWDGYYRIYSAHKQRIYTGLIPYVLEFAQKSGYGILYENQEKFKQTNNIDYENIKNFCLKIQLNGIIPEKYQIDAVYEAIKNRRKVICSPTGSGKSLIIYLLIRWILEHDWQFENQIALVVPSINLVNQMKSDFAEYATTDSDFDVEKHIQLIFGGQDKNFNKPIIISTWQSLALIPKKELGKFTHFIFDEVHKAQTGDEIQKVCESSNEADFRIGLTATVKNTKVHKLIVEGIFGPVYYAASTSDLIDKGKLSDITVFAVALKYSKQEVAEFNKPRFNSSGEEIKYTYQDEIDYVYGNDRRNRVIVRIAKGLTGNTLILFRFKEKQGKPIFDKLTEFLPDKNIIYVDGDTSGDEREKIRHTMNTTQDNILVASDVFATGVNIPSIQNLVLATSVKSEILLRQSIGRGLRTHEGKSKLHLFDIIDDMRYKRSHNYLWSHFTERLKIYREQKFKVVVQVMDFNKISM